MMINTNEWKEFQIQILFDVKAGKGDSKNTDIGTIPYVSATELNNGISKFVSCNDTALELPNTITISRNGSVGECFYHNYTYVASLDDIRVLTPINFELDKYIAHFVMTAIRLEKPRYNYGRKFGTDRIKKTFIKLPINTQGNPDWDYMRAYIKNTISQSTPKIQLALENIIELEKSILSQETPKLDTSTWKEFRYDEIFDISRGNSKYDNTSIGNYDYPLIGASQNENGCGSEYVSFYDYEGMYITVGNGGNTGCGQTFFQSGRFSAKSTANLLQLKNKELTQYIALFLVTLIRKEQYRYNFGRGWGLDRMKESIIKLPVDSNGQPDWDYMENYIKTLKYSSSI